MTRRKPGQFGFAFLLAALAMLGPFSIDAYLPAFPAMARDLPATPIEIQQTLTTYLIAFGGMMLWHGTLSDAVGRRPVIMVCLVIYTLGSIGCWFATDILQLWIYRAVQGLSAGAGIVVGRAMVRDRLEGDDAQRMMSLVTMIFSFAPAAAPIIGGFIYEWLGWRAIFGFLTLGGAALTVLCWFALPETLPKEHRQSLRPATLAANYWRVFRKREFQLLAAMLAFNFSGLFLFVASAPVLVLDHLSLTPSQFGWLFVPAVAGIFFGSLIANRLAGKIAPRQVIFAGFGIMFAAALINVGYHSALPAGLPWTIAPIAFYSLGMSMIMPNATLLVLDLFPSIRGLVSSFQGFCQTTMNGITAGLLAPLLFGSPLWLAAGQLAVCLIGFILFAAYVRGGRLASEPAGS